MSVSRDNIERLIADRALISIRRKRVDARSIQAFPLAVSQRLVLLQYVYDFHIDGFMLLRLRDISDLKIGDTNIFQRRLLQEEGVLDQVKFGFSAPMESFPDFLRSLPPTELVIIESELTDPPQMNIGTVASVDSRSVAINYMTGIARREETPRKMSVRDITSCQIRTNYISFYQRHFDRLTQ
jgi:hypothetical protein